MKETKIIFKKINMCLIYKHFKMEESTQIINRLFLLFCADGRYERVSRWLIIKK
jgi:hypothetical protein